MDTTNRRRIRIYTNVRHSLELAKKIYEKHQADGEGSLLSLIEGFSWEATGPKINFCLEKHKEAISLSKSAEEMYRQRDAILAEITDIMKASKTILKTNFSVNPEKLSEWGFILYDNSGVIEKYRPDTIPVKIDKRICEQAMQVGSEGNQGIILKKQT